MIVKNVKLKNYRNFEEVNIILNDNLNIFIGDNAQGKTNLLESIYISSIGRTFRINKEEELIKFGNKKSFIKLEIYKNNIIKKIELILEKNKKKEIKINGVKLEKNNELIGILNNVIFTPDDLRLVKGSPSERRKFINIGISQIKPNYKYLLKNYNKIIIQRNNLLKNINQKKKLDLLDIWNDYLIKIGTEILDYRNKYFKKLELYTKDIYSNISGNIEKLSLEYKSSIGSTEELGKLEISEIFRKKIDKNIENEIFRGITLYGPHKDDFIIKINNKDCKFFGSQGQQRTAAISLKLSEIEIIKEEIDEYPILLLDDVLSELDNKRKNYLMNYTKKLQTIITTTNDKDLYEIIKEKVKTIYYIKNGKIDKTIE